MKQCQSPPAPTIIIKENSSPPVVAASDPKSHNERVVDPIPEVLPIRDRLRKDPKQRQFCNWSEGFAFVAKCEEPQTYTAAVNSSESDKWKAAMDDEMRSLHHNQRRSGAFKARLVARGFSQQRGIDYQETFSPVVKFTSIRAILGIAATEKMQLKQFDVKTAFLYGDLSEEIYMRQPEGFSDGTDNVCKLQKSLYGLKQSARCWNQKFTSFLNKFELHAVEGDPCVFVNTRGKQKIILAIYIDDGLIAAKDQDDISTLLCQLQREFEIKVFDARDTPACRYTSYITKVLAKFNMLDAVSVSTPADTSVNSENAHDGQPVAYPFREAVGSLMYLAVATRPDIAFAISSVSRHLENPSSTHVTAVKRIMKYIKGTPDHGIFFSAKGTVNLEAFSDADYAGCRERG